MKIIVITSNGVQDKEAGIVSSLFEYGLQTLHVRKPRLSTQELSQYIEDIPSQFHNKIVIHSHHKLAAKYKLKGIHFTKNHLHHMNRTWWRLKMLSFKRKLDTLSFSCSHSKLATLYDKDDYKYNYVFLSPIFDSLTGKFQSGFHEIGIKAAISKIEKKIIARGGVDHTKVERINDLGFHGMALYSALWEKPDPLEEYVKVLKRIDELGIKTE